MKLLAPLLATVVALSAAYANEIQGTRNTVAPEQLATLAESASTVSITYYANRANTQATFADKEWTQRLATVLRNATYDSRPHCLCISFPTIEIKNDGKTVLTLSVHHGTKIRAYATGISGDFEVGAEIGKKISVLAGEKKDLAQPVKRPAPQP